MWEGNLLIDLLDTFVPWAKDPKTTRFLKIAGIPCTLVSTGGSSLACMPVSEQYPLRHIGHFVAGLPLLGSAVAGDSSGFDGFYAALGIAPLATVADGDCAFDVMKQMLGEVSTLESRTNLRIEICDYLIERVDELWMQELMVKLAEVDADDFKQSKTQEVQPEELGIVTTSLVAVPAVAAPVKEAEDEERSEDIVDELTFKAMKWASNLPHYTSVLSLIKSLPKQIVQEQIQKYRNKPTESAVAVAHGGKITLCPKSRYNLKMLVAARFHVYCQSRGICFEKRLPYGAMQQFLKDNIIWNPRQKNAPPLQGKSVRLWYEVWRNTVGNQFAAAEGKSSARRSEKCLLKSRSTVKNN